jgi:hypothetical protein
MYIRERSVRGERNFPHSRESGIYTLLTNHTPIDQNVKLILLCSVMYSIPEICYLLSHYASSSYVSACCSFIRHTNPFAIFAGVTWCVSIYCWSHKQHYIFQSICSSPRESGHCIKINITIVFMKVDGHLFIFGIGACTYGC